MKITVIGTGAMGSVYAALLAEGGHDVCAVDVRADHVAAIRDNGLRVEGASGDRTMRLKATTNAAEAGLSDLVVIATKAHDVAAAAESARAIIGPETTVITIQNGLGSGEVARGVLGDAVAVGVAGGFGARPIGPAHVRHEGWELMRFGEIDGPVTPRIRNVVEAWQSAGFRVRAYDDIGQLIWEKLLCNASFNSICALTGLTIGGVLDDPDASPVADACAREGFAVARAKGITLGFDDPVAYVRDYADKVRGARPSTLQDLEAGRRTEVGVINGGIARVGREVGVPTPTHDAITGLVKGAEAGRYASVG